MKPQYTNKLALITGGSSGIGLELAKIFASKGANVWILARRSDILSNALQNITEHRINANQQFGSISIDVSKQDQVFQSMRDFLDQHGTPDFLINAAGMAHPGTFDQLDVEIIRNTIEINLMGTIYICKAVIPAMIDRGSGYIVNISSIVGFIGIYGYTAYGASKYGIRGFSDILRAELKPHGINVSVVFPPDTQTPQLDYESQFKPAITKALSGNASILTAESVARAVISGIESNKYNIIPGFDGKLIFWLNNLLGDFVYPLMDYLIARADTSHR